MATISWPAVGENGLTEAQWEKMYGSPDGVIEDHLGTALALTKMSTENVCRIAPGLVRINGYVLEVISNDDLPCPAVGSPTTYLIYVQYDPALNVADVNDQADPLGPVRLKITTGAPDTSANKKSLALYTVTRIPSQPLSEAVVVDYRRPVASAVVWPWTLGAPPAGTYGQYPHGSLRFDKVWDRLLVRVLNDDNVMEWRPFSQTPAIAFPLAAGLIAFSEPPQICISNGIDVSLRGTVKRSSNTPLSTGNEVTLGTLPDGAKPTRVCRFVVDSVKTSSGDHFAASVKVEINGQVKLYPQTSTVEWLDLSNIHFRARV